MSDFAVRIKALRLAKGVTRDELAAALGLSKSIVARWELGNRKPSVAVLQKLVAFFGVTYNELLGE